MKFKVEPYPEELQKITTFQGFRFMFYQELKNFETGEEAYESIETIHSKYFGKRKYKSFHVFNVLRNRHIRN